MSKLWISLFLSLAAVSANALDVSGITLGSSLEEAKNGIFAINKSYKVQQYTMDGTPSGYMAVSCDGPECNYDGMAIFKGEGKIVWSVQRHQSFNDPKTRFTPSELLSSLQKKYGKPSYSDYSKSIWTFDRSGRQQFNIFTGDTTSPSYSQGPCFLNDAYPGLANPGLKFPTQVNETCGKYVYASYEERGGFVQWFRVEIADIAHIYDELKRKQQGVDEAQKREAEAQRAKGLKPNL